MKRKRNILFRVIFLLALLVNSGAVVYSNSNFSLNSNSIELTSNENAVEPGFSTDNNFAFNDQTDRFYTFRLTNQKIFLLYSIFLYRCEYDQQVPHGQSHRISPPLCRSHFRLCHRFRVRI